MGRHKKPVPTKEELLSHPDRKSAATFYKVSERTVIRWLDGYGEYHPKEGYGPHKLTEEKVSDMRAMHQDGMSIKDLATEFKVTFSSASRAIHRITYKPQNKGVAEVSVVYNVIA